MDPRPERCPKYGRLPEILIYHRIACAANQILIIDLVTLQDPVINFRIGGNDVAVLHQWRIFRCLSVYIDLSVQNPECVSRDSNTSLDIVCFQVHGIINVVIEFPRRNVKDDHIISFDPADAW